MTPCALWAPISAWNSVHGKPLILKNQQLEENMLRQTIHNLQYCMTRTRKKRQALGRYTVSLREQPQVPRSLFRSFRHQNNTVENQACRQRPCWWKWGSEPVQRPIEWEQEEMTLTMGQKLHKAKESHAGKRFKRQELLSNIPKVELTGLLQVWELNAVFPAKD